LQSTTQTPADNATTFYTIRLMTDDDIPAAVTYYNDLAKIETFYEPANAELIAEWRRNPMNREQVSLAFLREEDGSEGRVIGSVSVNHQPEDGKAWGWMSVHPDYRLRGLGNALYNWYAKTAEEAGATSLHIVPNSEEKLMIEFLERRGFALDRYFWAMRLDKDTPVEPPAMPEGFTVRTFVPGQDEPLWQHARNVTFADHYGSVPRTLEEITHLSKEEQFRPEGLFFAFEGGDEEKLAGFCFTGFDPREWETLGYTIGHVHTIGTMPEYRRRGIGRGLLLYAIDFLRKHVETVELGVEGKNRLALPLYENVGFHQHKAWANMEKKVAGGQ
jgi:mycothiol synthase